MKKEKLALQSWDDVEASLGEISKLKAEKERRTANRKVAIAKLTAEIDEQSVAIDFDIRQHEQNVMLFSRLHLEEIRADGKKSKQFVTGVIKTKKEDIFLYPPEDELIALIKGQKLSEEFLRTSEKPIKSVIKAKVKENPKLLEVLNIDVHDETNIIIEAF